MKRLTKIGFVKVGYWTLESSGIQLNLISNANTSNALYSFVSGGEVKYIGKTTRKLSVRLKGYQSPGPTQLTNIRVKEKIKDLLSQGQPLDIYILPDNGLLKIGDYNLSVPAGLEDNLINKINPDWNITGKNGNVKRIEERIQVKVDKSTNQEDLPTTNTIEIILWPAYYNQGFFNVRRKYSERFGADQDTITIQLGTTKTVIQGLIDRKANNNKSPRIRGRKQLTTWIQDNFNQGDLLLVDILSPVSIRLRKK